MRMAVPPDVAAGADAVQVTERSRFSGALANEGFNLASSRVESVDRNWDSSRSLGIGPYQSAKTEGGYSYVWVAPGGRWEGVCASIAERQDVGMAFGVTFSETSNRLGCTCKSGERYASLALGRKGMDEYIGQVTSSGGESWVVLGLRELDSGYRDVKPAGYRLDRDAPTADSPGKLVAAVEVLFPGRIWFARGLSEAAKEEAGCLLAGLLLYSPKEAKERQ